MTEVSDILRRLASTRQDLGMTRDEIATQLAVGRSTVREWEHTHQVPTLAHLVTWSQLLGSRIILLDPSGKVLRPTLARRTRETHASRETRRLALALRNQRRAREHSQQWLAEQLGITRPSVSRLENAGTTPRVQALAHWAALFHCELTVDTKPNTHHGPSTAP